MSTRRPYDPPTRQHEPWLEPWRDTVHSDTVPPYLEPELQAQGDELTIRLRLAAEAPVDRVVVRAIMDGIDHHVDAEREARGGRFAWWRAPLELTQPATHYHFLLRTTDGRTVYLNRAGASSVFPVEEFDFTINARYRPPRWVRESVFYQIFPDRFRRGEPSLGVRDHEIERDGFHSREMAWTDEPLPYSQGGSLDFFNGDLPGVVEKLPYLRELGVNALYLTPIFRAKTNHRYDCLDYFEVDPHLGGDDALASLIRAAHDAGIRVMLDVSINHIGVEHEWARGVSRDGTTVSVVQHDEDGRVVNWAGVPELLKLDYRREELRDLVYRREDSVVRRYLAEPFGIDAWRFDVASETGNFHADQLAHEVWREVRSAIHEENPDAYVIGEHWHDPRAYLQGDQWDSAMNYFAAGRALRMWLGEQDRFALDPPATTQAAGGTQAGGTTQAGGGTQAGAGPAAADEVRPGRAISGHELRELIEQHFNRIPSATVHTQFNLVDSHDVTRLHNHQAIFHWELYAGAVTLLALLPGTFSVYYGDEVGIAGSLDGDHGKRYPMPWDEREWDPRFRELYRRLIGLKRSHEALQTGSYRVLEAGDDYLVFARFTTRRAVVLVLNRSEVSRSLRLDLAPLGARSAAVLQASGSVELDGDHAEVRLPPRTSLLFDCELEE